MPITKNQILDSLKHIIDPDLNKDIVSLNFVKNIIIDSENNVSFDIELTTPACPVKETFKSQATEAIKRYDGVKNISINMTSAKKNMTSFSQPQHQLNNIGSIIAISSCKGGVGKSTLAAHMAYDLASRGFKVGLLDMDIYGPSIPALFGIKQVGLKTTNEKKLIPLEKNNLKLMSFGFLLGDKPAIMRGPIVTQYIQQLIFNTEWGKLDYLFLDMPPGTGDVQITITQNLQLNGAVIITTPHTLSLIDVARGIIMFEKVNVPVLGVIENMSYFQSPDSETKHFVFGENAGENLKEKFGINLIAEIPLLPTMTQMLNEPQSNSYIMEAVDKTIRALGKRSIEGVDIPNAYGDEKNITLKWSDGTTDLVSNFDLRLNSQDALSVNELTGESLLKPEDIREDIAAKKITPLGNYAITIEWNDGHSAGIYTYQLIRKLSKQIAIKA